MARRLLGEELHEGIRRMLEAAEVAKHATCLRAKCGAILVGQNGKTIGKGYNCPPGNDPSQQMCNTEPELHGKHDRTCCMHAEWCAIIDALRNGHALSLGKLYFTRVDGEGSIVKSGSPYCTVCSRIAHHSGVTKFILWHEDAMVEYDTAEFNQLSYANHGP